MHRQGPTPRARQPPLHRPARRASFFEGRHDLRMVQHPDLGAQPGVQLQRDDHRRESAGALFIWSACRHRMVRAGLLPPTLPQRDLHDVEGGQDDEAAREVAMKVPAGAGPIALPGEAPLRVAPVAVGGRRTAVYLKEGTQIRFRRRLGHDGGLAGAEGRRPRASALEVDRGRCLMRRDRSRCVGSDHQGRDDPSVSWDGYEGWDSTPSCLPSGT